MQSAFQNAVALSMLRDGQSGATEQDFAAMVAFADDLSRTAGDEPPFVARPPYALRPDEPAPGLAQAEVLQNAKALSGPMIAVPAPFGQDE